MVFGASLSCSETIVDNFSRKCLAIYVGQSLKGEDVVNVMEQIKQENKAVTRRIQVDNGSEFISNVDNTVLNEIRGNNQLTCFKR